MTRRHILQALAFRFTISEADRQIVAQQLETIVDTASLEQLFTAAMQRASLDAFYEVMRQALPN